MWDVRGSFFWHEYGQRDFSPITPRSVNKRGKHVSDGAVASLDEFQEVLEMMTGQRRSVVPMVMEGWL